MQIIPLCLLGVFYSAVFTTLFREFYVLSQQPIFHIPVIGIIICLEFLIGFIAYPEFSRILGKLKTFTLFLCISIFYLPVFSFFLTGGRTLMGLSFLSFLPWFAVTVYPLTILFPLIFSAGIVMGYMADESLYTKHILLGAVIYFVSDIAVLWHADTFITVLTISIIGLMILALVSIETLPKVKYWFLSVVFITLLFSSIPARISSRFRSFTREYKTQLVKTKKTPYGELSVLKKNNDYISSLNHSKLFKYPNTRNVQEIVHTALLQYPWAESVLVIGEWTEMIDEILRYPDIKNIYWADPAPDIFSLFPDVVPVNLYSKDYSRLRILSNSDPISFIKKIKNRHTFDIVFISLPNPVNIFLNRYYTLEFYHSVKAVLSDNSMIAITLKTGGPDIGWNWALLTASAYNTLKKVFPNTLELYGDESNILASHSRNFTTSDLALAEFINVMDTPPSYFSPSILKFKIDAGANVRKQLDIKHAPVNMDSKPASLKYSFNQLVLNFGIFPNLIIRMTDRINPILVYSFILALNILLVRSLSKKELALKLKHTLLLSSLVIGLFTYNIVVLLQTYYGRIYSDISFVFLFLCLGIAASAFYFRKKSSNTYLSLIRMFSMFAGFLLIILPTLFETQMNLPSLAMITVLSFAGGFLLAGSMIIKIKAYLSIDDNRPEALSGYVISGLILACLGSILLLPVTGTIELLPVLGIFNLGTVFILSI